MQFEYTIDSLQIIENKSCEGWVQLLYTIVVINIFLSHAYVVDLVIELLRFDNQSVYERFCGMTFLCSDSDQL